MHWSRRILASPSGATTGKASPWAMHLRLASTRPSASATNSRRQRQRPTGGSDRPERKCTSAGRCGLQRHRGRSPNIFAGDRRPCAPSRFCIQGAARLFRPVRRLRRVLHWGTAASRSHRIFLRGRSSAVPRPGRPTSACKTRIPGQPCSRPFTEPSAPAKTRIFPERDCNRGRTGGRAGVTFYEKKTILLDLTFSMFRLRVNVLSRPCLHLGAVQKSTRVRIPIVPTALFSGRMYPWSIQQSAGFFLMPAFV